MMWVEKYRPSKLEDLVDQGSTKLRLKLMLQKAAQLPHLLFAGPPGSGKTTTAIIIAQQILGDYWRDYTLSLNASDERGIDMVRERVKTFARHSDRREGVPFRIIILDESDEMTHDSQTALRRIMEEYSTATRFILVCNYSSGIIEPLQSRCAIFRFQRLDEASVTEHLKTIAKKEKVGVASDAVFGAVYEATQGDLRQAINLLQAASASGEVTVDSVKSVSGASVKSRVAEVVKTALEGNFESARTKMVELTRVYGIPERDFLRYANETLGSMNLDDAGRAISILAEYDYRLVQGSQPELQLTAMLAQLSSLKRRGD
jgi:replication factor C small subunit